MQQLEIIRGDSLELQLDFATNITGATVFFTAKSNIEDSDEDAVLKTEVTSHQSAVDGISIVSFTAAETDALEPGNYVYDIQIKYAGGEVESWKHSSMSVVADVTRRTE